MKKKPAQQKGEEPETRNDRTKGEKGNTITFRGPKAKKEFVEGDRPEEDEHKEQVATPRPGAAPQRSNVVDRTVWTIIMLLGFIGIIMAGHFYCALLIFALDVGMFKEILALKRNPEKESKIPYSSFVNWYFFVVATIFFYGKLFSNKLAGFTLSNKFILDIVIYHNFVCFLLWVLGFLMFTLSLKKGFLRYQFRQFAWTHIAIFLIVGQCSAIINNLYEGLIWFVVPCLLVIINDTCAYIFGKMIGKTQLIALSPKKTLEGFIGGMASTVVFAVFVTGKLSQFQYLVCPQNELTVIPFDYPSCQTPNVFEPFLYHTPELPVIGSFSFIATEFQAHAFVLALFTSLVSPFGGFFASGFKRAIKVKDFAEVIPGHGGITDRMDCQMITGMFTYLYVHQVIYGRMTSINGVIAFMSKLSEKDLLSLYLELKDILISKGLLKAPRGALHQ